MKIRAAKEDELAATLDSIGDAVIATDRDGNITYMNPAAKSLTGWTFGEAQEMPLKEVLRIMNAGTGNLVSDPAREALRSGKVRQFSGQTVVHTREAKCCCIIGYAAPIQDSNGWLYGAVLVFRDVARQDNEPIDLVEPKAQSEEAISFNPSALYKLSTTRHDRGGYRVGLISDAIERITGYCAADWLADSNFWIDHVHPEDRPSVCAAQDKLLKEGHLEHEYRFEHADGGYRWIRDHLILVPNEADQPGEIVGIWMDITSSKESEAANLRLGEIVERSLNEIYVFDAETLRFELVNEGARRNLAYDMDELRRMTPLDLTPEYTAKRFAELTAPLRSGRKSLVLFETVHKRKDGSQYPVEVRLQLFDDAVKAVFVALILDISERKTAEERISRLSQFYAAQSRINDAIIHLKEEAELFETVCRIAVDVGGVQVAWIGKVEGETGRIVPVASAGDGCGCVGDIVISLSEDAPDGRGPTSTAMRENRAVIINDCQDCTAPLSRHDRLDGFSWESSAAIAIARGGNPYASLNVYARAKNAFDADVTQLLEEMAANIVFALELIEQEAARREGEEHTKLLAQVFEQSKEGIIITDAEKNIISINRAFTEITGYQEDEVCGRNPRFLASARHDRAFYRQMWRCVNREGYWQGEIWNRRKNGEIYPQWLSISRIVDATGRTSHYIGIHTDLTRHKEAEAHIEYLAHYDALTELPNRALLEDRVKQGIAMAKRKNELLALLFIDLDHFKNINDSLGHPVGDQVLIAVAQRLKESVRAEDTVSRLGGDEFNVLLVDTGAAGAAMVSRKIIATLAAPVRLGRHMLYVTPSIGISLFPDNGADYETLSRSADTALYQAKKNGRNQYQFFTHEMQVKTVRRMELESHLRQALKRGELKLVFQPQMDIATREIVGAEALLRWHHPQLGEVSPAEFIPVAEDSAMILAIGDWVLERAIAQAKTWQQAGLPPMTIAVNFSLAQFRENVLLEKTRSLLKKYELDAGCLGLELTESVAMQNADAAIEIIRQLRELGIQLSIDDFGTGYSSLSYLKRFAINKVKIDQTFVRDITSDPEDAAIVDAIISMGRSLGVETIAEGVETEAQFISLSTRGCGQIQGYYFSKPLSSAEFFQFVKRHRKRGCE